MKRSSLRPLISIESTDNSEFIQPDANDPKSSDDSSYKPSINCPCAAQNCRSSIHLTPNFLRLATGVPISGTITRVTILHVIVQIPLGITFILLILLCFKRRQLAHVRLIVLLSPFRCVTV